MRHWSDGSWVRCPQPNKGFSGLTDVITEDFTPISPRGMVDQAVPLMAQIDNSLGVQTGIRFSIRIENCWLRFADGPHCMGTYEERQERECATTVQLSTVLFHMRTNRRNGLEWLHLNETWLEGHAAAC